MGGVFLDAREQVERGARAGAVASRLQTHPHHAVEHEGQEADHRVCTDALWQPVVNRRDLDVGSQDAEAALDVGEGLVARDGLGRALLQNSRLEGFTSRIHAVRRVA